MPFSLRRKLHSRPVNGTYLRLGENWRTNLYVPKMLKRLSRTRSKEKSYGTETTEAWYFQNSMVVVPEKARNQCQIKNINMTPVRVMFRIRRKFRS